MSNKLDAVISFVILSNNHSFWIFDREEWQRLTNQNFIFNILLHLE